MTYIGHPVAGSGSLLQLATNPKYNTTKTNKQTNKQPTNRPCNGATKQDLQQFLERPFILTFAFYKFDLDIHTHSYLSIYNLLRV